MVTYQGQVIDRNTGEVISRSRWYTTWEQAHRAVDLRKWASDNYQIEVIDKD